MRGGTAVYRGKGSLVKLSLRTVTAAAVLLFIPFGILALGAPPNAPFAGAAKMNCDQALKQAPKDDPALVPMDKEFNAVAAKLKKSPKDAKIKKTYVETAYKYGHQVEYDEKLSTVVKYRASLALYRKVIVVDPKHAPTLTEKKKIEDVYAGMGMPIPK